MLIINRLPEGAYTGNRRVMKREKVRAEELDFIYTDDKGQYATWQSDQLLIDK